MRLVTIALGTLLLLSAGCVGFQPQTTEHALNCTVNSSITSEDTSYPPYSPDMNDSERIGFVREFEKGIAQTKYKKPSQGSFSVDITNVEPRNNSTLHNADSTIENDSTIVTIEEVYVSGTENGDPFDLRYAATYLLSNDGVKRIQRYRGSSPLAEKAVSVINCS